MGTTGKSGLAQVALWHFLWRLLGHCTRSDCSTRNPNCRSFLVILADAFPCLWYRLSFQNVLTGFLESTFCISAFSWILVAKSYSINSILTALSQQTIGSRKNHQKILHSQQVMRSINHDRPEAHGLVAFGESEKQGQWDVPGKLIAWPFFSGWFFRGVLRWFWIETAVPVNEVQWFQWIEGSHNYRWYSEKG